jgi:hypothetical protein
LLSPIEYRGLAREPGKERGRELSIAFVATCPPRQCGIATISKDLEGALKAADGSVRIQWAAINEATSIHPYGPEVRWRIRQGQPESYRGGGRAVERGGRRHREPPARVRVVRYLG